MATSSTRAVIPQHVPRPTSGPEPRAGRDWSPDDVRQLLEVMRQHGAVRVKLGPVEVELGPLAAAPSSDDVRAPTDLEALMWSTPSGLIPSFGMPVEGATPATAADLEVKAPVPPSFEVKDAE